MHYVSLKLRMCQNTTTFTGCKPQSQIDSFFRGKTLSVTFTNTLFDTTNFDDPVSYYLDDKLFMVLDTTVTKYANLFVQLSSASLTDDLLQILPQQSRELEFFQVQNLQ